MEQQNDSSLAKFENFLRYEKHMADLSIVAYMRDLRQFEEYLQADILTTKTNDVRSFVVAQVEAKKAPKSINRRISAIHVFFKYALFKQIIDSDPSELVQYVKQPKTIPTFITEKQLEQIVDNQELITYEQILNYTILYTLYSTGLRRSELASLNHDNVDLHNDTITVTGKGSKTRIVPISEELKFVILRYITFKNDYLKSSQNIDIAQKSEEIICQSEKKSLFLTQKNKPISHDQIYGIIKKTAKQFGLPSNCSPHTLRHTFATHLLNQNVPLRSIQELLGHANLNTTQIYTHTSTEELKKSFINAHPRA